MATYNIVNEDEQEGYSFLKDPAIVSSVENFLETIESTGVVSKSMVLSLEETIADKVITDKYSLNMFTSEPSKIGVKETKKVIKTILNSDNITREATYTLDDVASALTKNINLINNLIMSITNINNYIDIDLIEKIKSGEVKYYNDNNILTDIKEFDIVDMVSQSQYYQENNSLFNNDALNAANKQYEENENLTPDMVFLRLFSLIGLSEDTNTMDLLINGLERYTVGDVVNKLSSLNELINALTLSKEYAMAGLKAINVEIFNNRMLTKHYKMITRIHDILVNDPTIYYLELFTKK